MKKLLYVTILALTVCLAYSQISFAVCVQGPPNTFTCNTDPPNPDTNGVQTGFTANNVTVNVLPGAAVDTTGSNVDALQTSTGMDQFNINNGTIVSDESGIDSRSNADQIVVDGSSIVADRFGIDSGSGTDQIVVDGSSITSGNDGIFSNTSDDTVTVSNSIVTGADGIFTGNSGNDIVTVTDSIITGDDDDFGIRTSNDDDNVTVVRSVITGGGDGIDLGSDNDTLTMGTGADIRGSIRCGSGFDTLIFAMDVPEERLNFFSNQIAAASLPDGSVTINGLFYEWQDCEILVNELVGVRVTRPIPTLSEWGLIATAWVLGFIAILVIRRKKLTA